jgi:hypothetical protein
MEWRFIMLDKPTVFIGSSSEGLKTAEAMRDAFGDQAAVEVWNGGTIFSRNKSFLSSLLDAASLFEFGILVFTADDLTLARDELNQVARDNVLFEFGLFLGRLGPRRAYALVQDKLHVPSDLAGITLDHFKLGPDQSPTAGFAATAARLVADILDFHRDTAEFSLLPSTALAIGYFQNFLSRVCDNLDELDPVHIGDRWIAYKTFKLHIVIPDELKMLDDMNLKSVLRRLTSVKIDNQNFREFAFYMQAVPPADATHLDLFDIPTTLRASRETVQRIFKQEYVGKSKLQARAEAREVANFEKTLRLLIAEVPAWERNIQYHHLSEFLP